jgi:hypothetical protein
LASEIANPQNVTFVKGPQFLQIKSYGFASCGIFLLPPTFAKVQNQKWTGSTDHSILAQPKEFKEKFY